LTYQTTTHLFRVDAARPESEAIQQAARTLLNGGLVAFPTETVYGLGANALEAAAIDRIYAAKQRPAGDPIIAHIYDTTQLATLARDVPDIAWRLAATFWPGPLTLVLKRAPQVPANIAAGLDTVAVRMPSHPVARALLLACDVPIAAPSANTFTRPSATTADHVLEDLDGRVDVVLDAGPTTIGLESTVVDLTGSAPAVLRPGGVTVESLRALIPEVRITSRFLTLGEDATPSASPGQLTRHYSPHAEVRLFSGPAAAVTARMQADVRQLGLSGKRAGVLAPDEDYALFADHAEIKLLGPRADLDTISHRLFAAMRMLDGLHVDVILVRDFGRDGLGAALWDRLVRAAEGHVIEVI
jgi:L-threonylcarbamoyladenylate synthase